MSPAWLGQVRTWVLIALSGAAAALPPEPVAALDLATPPDLPLIDFRQSLETPTTNNRTTPALAPEAACVETEESVQAPDLLQRLQSENQQDVDTAIVVSGMHILGDLDLSEIEFKRPLQIENAVLCGRLVMWPRTIFQRGASFKGTKVFAGADDPRSGVVVAHGLQSAANLNLTEMRAGAILMKNAKVEGRIELIEAEFGALDLHGAEVGRLALTAAFQSNMLALELIQVLQQPPGALGPREWLGEHAPPFVRGVVRMSDLRVNGQLNGQRFRSEGVTILNDATIEELRFRASHFGALDMRGVRVSSDIRMMGATLGDGLPHSVGEIGCAPREVMLFVIDFVDFSDARIGRDLKLEAWQDTTKGSAQRTIMNSPACMARMQVVGNVDISGVDGNALSFRSTQIGRSLKLETPESGALIVQQLDLNGSAARTLVVGSDFRFPDTTDLAGAKLEHIDSPEGPDSIEAAMSGATTATRTVGYRVFEQAFTSSGNLSAARDVALLREQAITDARPIWAKPFRWAVNALSGHGLRPERTLLALMLASLAGAIVALQAPEARAFLTRQNAAPPARPLPQSKRRVWIYFDAFILSFDRLIPIISLNDEHKKIVFHAKRWTRAYFVLHGVFGMLLAATAVSVLGKSLGLDS